MKTQNVARWSRVVLLTGLLVSSSSVNAVTPRGRTSIGSSAASFFEERSATYQIGDEWGKKPVTPAVLSAESPVFVRAARATAKAGGGTSFYLGKFAGAHVMATNHHVFPAAYSCLGRMIQFPHLGARSFKCKTFLGTWPEIDLALFTLEVPQAADEQVLAEVAGNFAFDRDLSPNQELLTIGFGVANNSSRVMMSNQDQDCRVFSRYAEYRLMGDPDEINPGTYSAWSFANGCDVSHGDSGSAMVDRRTGDVVGIIWTGRIPKQSSTQKSDVIAEWMRTGSEMIWKELSYAVPSVKIGEFLERIAELPSTDSRTREILEALTAR